ncbi:MAG TPA: hypothetical protein PK580_01875 [Nitrosomonas halophila]|nr:hypothetical protein [Nitrosomonas halophila]
MIVASLDANLPRNWLREALHAGEDTSRVAEKLVTLDQASLDRPAIDPTAVQCIACASEHATR